MALKTIRGTTGNDRLTGGGIAELILGLAGNDKLFGNGGADTIKGGDGNDLIDGGLGGDTLLGQAGNDSYIVDNANDKVRELANEGTDTVSASISYTLTANVEKLVLTGTADINATGNGLDNVLTGNDGNNVLDGGAGNDTMAGKAGDDTYMFADAGDKATEQVGGGTDTVMAAFSVTLAANIENLVLTGSANVDGTGNAETNKLTGNDGNNSLDGGTGNDWMLGGLGDDTYRVDSTIDKITENADAGTDSVYSTVTYTLSVNVENLTLSGSSAINGTGNALANILTGNGAANKLYADNVVGDSVGGGDQLIGGGGNDTLYSGDGANTLDGGDGTGDLADYTLFTSAVTVNADTFVLEVTKTGGSVDSLSNIESVRGSTAADVFTISTSGNYYGGNGDDDMSDGAEGDGLYGMLYGEAGSDTLTAGADGGNLNGGADADTLVALSVASLKITMTGGSGADLFDVGANYNGSGGSLADGTLAASTEIKDFVDGTDQLLFHAFGDVDTAEEWYALIVANNDIETNGNEMQISFDNSGQTLIVGLTAATFSADDIFVLA
ncbi:beta strand repeat-containing protein [Rhizobium alvei]|uniref:Calcium-binding protein n=1 Tax=Rhizobium alvei TaxID=1132659 RepID=A0ABT8YFB6_9HYPH|nr:calcium-binding protein [Rhizobium alvei]MDO6962400.1 calcium-binding protein [Rhizobium alvei]